ncbi:regulatory inactivation of DnaA Hda protein [Magnetococcus marinus MC-1]|uniref:Regulatory inactivation of DnaA Hda protein n=1 Tax=Magnetococcus marinus (strain ATCC BAA-1437 / JCM 17883 / MC-1) TaxID=156889 RepID=A0LA20_MAGMM|nr:DnaA/Hda family protein [Magnetococcus marinus]ABK44813.1 regulatory inactivation of DnaA Hda protein [Magnetococcus marinus MC-1]
MHTGSAQLLIAFPLDPVLSWENLVVGAHNTIAIHGVRQLEAAKVPGLILTGAAGAGKTHLLQAAVASVRAQYGEHAAVYLDLATLSKHLENQPKAHSEALLSRFIDRYGSCRLAAIDELELLEHAVGLQEGVLYLYNRLRVAGGHLLGAGREDPSTMSGLRDDLRSRLLWGPVLHIDEPDEVALGQIMDKMAADRQLRLSEAVRHFLLLRLPRSVPVFAQTIQRLDEEALRQQRALTVPLAKEVLGL